MAWTISRTWVAAEVMTASNMNTYVRDNLNSLVTYTTYTPALTATTTNPTLGTGSSATGVYCLQGNSNGHADLEGKILFGTSGVAAGTGFYRISSPVTLQPYSTDAPIGECIMFDSSASQYSRGVCVYISTTTFAVNIYATTATSGAVTALSATAPFVPAANDWFAFRVRCRAST